MSNTHLSYAEAKGYNFEFYSVILGEERTVRFPAFITNLQDSFASNWNSQNVFGRQDPIITFQNTQRTINVGFDVPAASKGEARDNLTKLNQLITFLYPAYQKAGTANSISASPLFKIKFANLIYNIEGSPDGSVVDSGLVCGIQNFQHQFYFDNNSNWIDRENQLIPMKFSISFAALILHTHDLGFLNGEDLAGAFDNATRKYPYNTYDFNPSSTVREAVEGNANLTRIFNPDISPANSLSSATFQTGGRLNTDGDAITGE
jgi:hypothetical protein